MSRYVIQAASLGAEHACSKQISFSGNPQQLVDISLARRYSSSWRLEPIILLAAVLACLQAASKQTRSIEPFREHQAQNA